MTGRRNRGGFTLVEILVSILILGVVMSAVVTIFFSVFESYQFHQDISEAKQRGHIAIASIQTYVSEAALGLPTEKNDFQDGFSFSSRPPLFVFDDDDPTSDKNFTGPVQLASGDAVLPDDALEGPELWLVYGEPSGFGVETDYEADTPAGNIELTGELDAAANTGGTNSWIVFPAGISPLFISAFDPVDGKIVSVSSAKAQKIYAFEEAHYLKAVKIQVDDDVLYIERSDGSGAQPAVEGIEGMWCNFDPDGDRVLRVTVLARGDTVHTSAMQSSIEGWPSAAPQPSDRRYRYATVTRSWRIRN